LNSKEYRQLVGVAKGSAAKVGYHLRLARDLAYIDGYLPNPWNSSPNHSSHPTNTAFLYEHEPRITNTSFLLPHDHEPRTRLTILPHEHVPSPRTRARTTHHEHVFSPSPRTRPTNTILSTNTAFLYEHEPRITNTSFLLPHDHAPRTRLTILPHDHAPSLTNTNHALYPRTRSLPTNTISPYEHDPSPRTRTRLTNTIFPHEHESRSFPTITSLLTSRIIDLIIAIKMAIEGTL